jgi:TonB family protein
MDDGSSREPRAFARLGVLASVAAHAAVVWVLWGAPEIRATPRAPTRVELSVAPARVDPAPSLPAPAEPAPSVPTKPRKPAASRNDAVSRPAEAAPAPADSEPAAIDLSGVTLTNDGAGASWAALAGSGASRSGPIRAGVGRGAGADTQEKSNGAALVPLGNLSRRPAPPALDSLLRSHYPAEARQLAIGGVAVVRARIGTNGRVLSASVASETRPGFGAACRKTLLGSRWTPPLDRAGQAVMTDVSYTCRFRVDD